MKLNKESIIGILFTKKFVQKELLKFNGKDKKAIIKYLSENFIDDYIEYIYNDEYYQIFIDSFGNIDIWKDGHIIRTLYKDKKTKEYNPPLKFINKLIEFGINNIKQYIDNDDN